MRVAVVTADGAGSAPTRYRALQHLPRLRARLGTVDLFSPADVGDPSGRLGRGRFFAGHAGRYLMRGVALARALSGYDAVLVQRGVYPMGPGWATWGLERFAGRVVFDLDDAVFLPAPGMAAKGRAARWLYGPDQAIRLLRRADATVVSSVELASLLPDGMAATVLPTVPDPDRYPVASHVRHRPALIGWVGGPGNRVYLDPLRETLRRLDRQGVAHLEVVSSLPWAGPASFRRWTLAEEASVFARFAVTIMPLSDTPYARAKAGFKLLQSMAAGVPVVASPIGVNAELVEASGAGLLADGAAEWERALRGLAEDPALRAELGARGRRFVERYADLDGQADALAALLRGRAPSIPRSAARHDAS